jgi:putative ABC transport system permease protein
MPSLRIFWRNVFRKKQAERELAEELAAYADLVTEENAGRGMGAAEARREALIAMGGVEQVKERVREVSVTRIWDGFFQDAWQSLRSLRRSAGSALLAVGTLAIGLGATTLIFSVFHAALLEKMPFRDPERLVELWETRANAGWDQSAFSRPNFWAVQDRNTTFESIGALLGGDMNMTGAGDPVHLAAASVSARFFHVLGVAPVVGRDFDPDQDAQGRDGSVVLLSNKFWRTRFGASRDVVGTGIYLDGRRYAVIGVIPPGEPWLNAADVFVPMVRDPKLNPGNFEAQVIGRLKPGVSIDRARVDLRRIADDLAKNYRAGRGMGVRVAPSEAWGARPAIRRALCVLLGATGLLLLIACMNVANLLLVRASARGRELRVRRALGAGRWRIVRLVLAESVMIGGAGAAVGLLIANVGLRVIRAAEIPGIPRITEVGLNGPVLGFALLITMIAALVAGLMPALESASSGDIAGALREGDRTQTAGRNQNRTRAVLVAAEVALSMVLLVGAGLLMRSFGKLLSVPRGFETEGRVIAAVNIPYNYDDARAKQVTQALIDRVTVLPGVRAVGTVNSRPIAGWDPGMGIGARDAAVATGDVPWASWRYVSAGYFRAMGMRLKRGREFTAADFGQADVRRAMVSEAVADLLWPGQDPVGRHIVMWKGFGNKDAEVVGVVANTRDHGLDADPTRVVYLAKMGQTYSPVQLVVDGPVTDGALRAVLAGIDPKIPVSQVETMDELVSRSVGSRRMNAALITGFAVIALLLSMTGIYGVLAYSVARRTAEIGIRVALGADGAGIFRLIVREGMRPVLAGMALGLAGSAVVGRLIESLLFGVKPMDAVSYGVVIALIAMTGLISCVLPARRALSVDPAAALREG